MSGQKEGRKGENKGGRDREKTAKRREIEGE